LLLQIYVRWGVRAGDAEAHGRPGSRCWVALTRALQYAYALLAGRGGKASSNRAATVTHADSAPALRHAAIPRRARLCD
jgi:hypothetical protein